MEYYTAVKKDNQHRVGESHKHNVEQNKADAKGSMLCASMNMTLKKSCERWLLGS